MASVAPGVKILPVRAGQAKYYPEECYKEGVNPIFVARGFRYAQTMGADIIVTAQGAGGVLQECVDAANAAARQGILHFNGAGNTNILWGHGYTRCDSTVLVTGLSYDDSRWDEGDEGSNYGSWFDIAARADNLYVAIPHYIACNGVFSEHIYQGG